MWAVNWAASQLRRDIHVSTFPVSALAEKVVASRMVRGVDGVGATGKFADALPGTVTVTFGIRQSEPVFQPQPDRNVVSNA